MGLGLSTLARLRNAWAAEGARASHFEKIYPTFQLLGLGERDLFRNVQKMNRKSRVAAIPKWLDLAFAANEKAKLRTLCMYYEV